MEFFSSVAALAATISAGATLAIPADYAGVSMAATFALIRQGVRDLSLVAAPVSGIQADCLIGLGRVRDIQAAGVSLGEYGPADQFRRAVSAGRVRMVDATCPAMHAAFQAAAKGVPFLPLRGVLGTDLLAVRDDWRVIDNPFSPAPDPIVLIPAIRRDVTLFHAPLADAAGNVWIGGRGELAVLAQAARRCLVTVDALHPTNLLDDPQWAAGCLAHIYVSGVAVAPGGCWPLGLPGHGPADDAAMARYAQASRDDDSFAALMTEWLA